MSKYIDAEKLIAYLKKTMESYKSQMVDPTKYPIEHIDLMAFLAREYQAIIANVESLQQEQPEGNLEYWLEHFGMPKENIDNCITQIAQGYGACRYLEGIQHGAEAVNELAKQEQPEFVKEIWHKVSEEANLTRPVVLSDGDKYMSPPCTFPFKDMSGFVEAMNKRYKADYTIWAYMDDLLNISSLQQEQPMPDSTKLIELWHEDKEMLKEKDFRNDPWRLAYNAFMCGFGRGIAVKKQEQPEVDLEKEIEVYFKGWTETDEGIACHYQYVDLNTCRGIARYFYELGRLSNK